MMRNVTDFDNDKIYHIKHPSEFITWESVIKITEDVGASFCYHITVKGTPDPFMAVPTGEGKQKQFRIKAALHGIRIMSALEETEEEIRLESLEKH